MDEKIDKTYITSQKLHMISYITDLPMRMTPWNANGCLRVSVHIIWLFDTLLVAQME